jgi:katanin p80 WD40 repeat-containing subunit B1
MSSNNKRAFKLVEFTAHAPSNVNCVTIGSKSQRIAATGGEDKKVNLWTITKPTCIMVK